MSNFAHNRVSRCDARPGEIGNQPEPSFGKMVPEPPHTLKGCGGRNQSPPEPITANKRRVMTAEQAQRNRELQRVRNRNMRERQALERGQAARSERRAAVPPADAVALYRAEKAKRAKRGNPAMEAAQIAFDAQLAAAKAFRTGRPTKAKGPPLALRSDQVNALVNALSSWSGE